MSKQGVLNLVNRSGLCFSFQWQKCCFQDIKICTFLHKNAWRRHVSMVYPLTRENTDRLWRVPATLPYPDINFTTRTLPGKVLKISGFRVVTIYAVSTQLRREGILFHNPPYTGFRNMKVTICQKHSSWTNTTTSCNYDCNFEVFTLFCSELGMPSEKKFQFIWEFCCNLRIFWL